MYDFSSEFCVRATPVRGSFVLQIKYVCLEVRIGELQLLCMQTHYCDLFSGHCQKVFCVHFSEKELFDQNSISDGLTLGVRCDTSVEGVVNISIVLHLYRRPSRHLTRGSPRLDILRVRV